MTAMGAGGPASATDTHGYHGATAEAHPDDAAWDLKIGLTLLGLGAFRIAALAFNGTDLFVDEAQYWAWAQEPALGYFSKPPLIAWLIAGTTALCRDGEFCIRLSAPLLHLATSAIIYVIGRQLISAEAGFWSALAFATLPAVSLSSGIMSTDVPLLTLWALALLAFGLHVAAPSYGSAILLGVAIGIGLNAKYAMAYFVPCAAVYFLIAPEHRRLLTAPHLWLALAIGIALIVPNLAWNAANSFATFAHTADNANWKGFVLHPGKALEFILGQFGVFGPIFFAALVAILGRSLGRLRALPAQDRLLLAFSVPIILAVICQSLLSRANANWAAPAYVSATLLVVTIMLRDGAWRWLRTSLALHAFVAVALALAAWQAGRVKLPIIGDPFARTLGSRELAESVQKLTASLAAEGRPVRAFLAGDRDVAATLAYYGRHLGKPILALRAGRPRHHFELAHAFGPGSPTPLLLVADTAISPALTGQFKRVMPLEVRTIAAGRFETRTYYFAILDEPLGR